VQTFTRSELPEVGWREFRKVGTTRIVRINGPFVTVTREGPLHCPDGWLALDRGGWPYPIAADEHELIYEAA